MREYLQVIAVVHGGGAQGQHQLALDVFLDVSDNAAHFRQIVVDGCVVVSLAEVVTQASTLSAAQNLRKNGVRNVLREITCTGGQHSSTRLARKG